MDNQSTMVEYPIFLEEGYSEDWHKIVGLSIAGAFALNKYTVENYPLGMQELKEIKKMLEAYVAESEKSMFGVRIEYQNEIEGEITIVQVSMVNQELDKGKDVKEQIWNRVMDIGISAQFSSEFDQLIRENMDRVEFVRDGIGLRDFLFIATRNATDGGFNSFVNDLFLSMDSDVEKHDTFEILEEKSKEGIETRELVILGEVEKFFTETNRTLFIGVGFRENLDFIDQVDDIVRWSLEAKEKGIGLVEILRQKRVFPKWYGMNTIMPEDAVFVPKNAEKYLVEYLGGENLKTVKKELKKMKKTELLKMIEKL